MTRKRFGGEGGKGKCDREGDSEGNSDNSGKCPAGPLGGGLDGGNCTCCEVEGDSDTGGKCPGGPLGLNCDCDDCNCCDCECTGGERECEREPN